MGHECIYRNFPDKKGEEGKRACEAEMNLQAKYNSDNHHGLPGAIRWISGHICENENDAFNYINKVDTGNYDQLAVRYKKVDADKMKSAKLETLRNQMKEAERKLYALNKSDYFKDFKAAFISCKKCGSKINKDFLYHYTCPICRGDLRSPSHLEKVNRAKAKIKEIEAKIFEENRRLEKKHEKTAELWWLVKAEYHC